jgi:hypothetical protein
VFAALTSKLANAFRRASVRFTLSGSVDGLSVNSESVSFFLARWRGGERETFAPHWSIKRLVHVPEGWIIAIRLGERNEAVLDYLLLRTADVTSPLLRFTESARVRRGLERFGSFDALVKSLIQRVTKPSRVSLTKPARQNRQLKTRPSKRRIGVARNIG